MWFDSWHWQLIFLFSKHPHQLWDPPIFLFTGYQGLSPWGKAPSARSSPHI